MEPTTFAELGLSAKVLAAIEASGYTQPTPIQAEAIPVAVTGRDVLGIAQTGTGKTAAFVMPMISRLEVGRARARMPRSLILLPTRELATQVAQSFEKYGQNHKLALALLIGGVSMDDQTAKLDRGVDVLIATPGRLLDHFGRGRVMLMGVEILVIDEADRMLDMGFIPDIEKICKLLPPRRQTLFFSATMAPEITRLVDQFLTNPQRIEVAKPATTAKTITQRFQFCPDGEDFAKREILRGLIKSENVKNAIIFCNRKRDVAILHKSLLKHGFNAGALHGDMDQSSRTATLDKFRAGEILLLAASDVAARGLDIPDVSHVFNFDVPWQADDYVHRIGRTGRAGKDGFSATLVTLDDVKAIKEIEKLVGEPPVWLGEAPSEEDLAEGAKRKGGRGKGKPAAGRGGRPGSSRSGSDRTGSDRASAGRADAGRPASPRPAAPRPSLASSGEAIAILNADAVGDPGASIDGGELSTRERSRNRRQRPDGAERTPRTDRQPRAERQPRPPRNPPRAADPTRPVDEPQRPSVQTSEPRADVAPFAVAPGSGDQPHIDAHHDPRPVPQRTDTSRPSRDRGPERGNQRNDAPRGDRSGNPRGDRGGDRAARPPRQAMPQRDDQPVVKQGGDDRGGRDLDQPVRRDTRSEPFKRSEHGHRPQDLGPRVGFQDNVPAFLRKPTRTPG